MPMAHRTSLHFLSTLLIDAAGQKAAVDHQHVASHIAGRIRRQKCCGSPEFINLPKTPHGGAHQEFFASLGTVEESRIQFRAHRAGCDRVHAYARRRPFG